MPQGDSKPSVGTEKSTKVVGLPTVSTHWKLGSCWANGADSKPSRFMAAKFSPLIQIRSTVPSVALRPACFSARTRLTTSAASLILTCCRFRPKSRLSSATAHWM